jgi:hypothetical protein
MPPRSPSPPSSSDALCDSDEIATELSPKSVGLMPRFPHHSRALFNAPLCMTLGSPSAVLTNVRYDTRSEGRVILSQSLSCFSLVERQTESWP